MKETFNASELENLIDQAKEKIKSSYIKPLYKEVSLVLGAAFSPAFVVDIQNRCFDATFYPYVSELIPSAANLPPEAVELGTSAILCMTAAYLLPELLLDISKRRGLQKLEESKRFLYEIFDQSVLDRFGKRLESFLGGNRDNYPVLRNVTEAFAIFYSTTRHIGHLMTNR